MRTVLAAAMMLMAGTALAQTTPRTSGGQLSPGPTSQPVLQPGVVRHGGGAQHQPDDGPALFPCGPSTPPSGAPPDVVMVPK